MNAETWAGFGTTLGALAIAVLGYIRSRTANKRTVELKEEQKRLKAGKADQEAQERAFRRLQNIYEAGLKQLEEQLGRVREDLETERGLGARLRARIEQLEKVVSRLRELLRRHGIKEDTSDD